MFIRTQNDINKPNFGRFLKISGDTKHLNKFRNELKEESDNFTSFIKKSEKKSFLYIISGKDFDKFLDLLPKIVTFMDFRLNPEKFLKKKPKNFKLKDAISKLNNNKLL